MNYSMLVAAPSWLMMFLTMIRIIRWIRMLISTFFTSMISISTRILRWIPLPFSVLFIHITLRILRTLGRITILLFDSSILIILVDIRIFRWTRMHSSALISLVAIKTINSVILLRITMGCWWVLMVAPLNLGLSLMIRIVRWIRKCIPAPVISMITGRTRILIWIWMSFFAIFALVLLYILSTLIIPLTVRIFRWISMLSSAMLTQTMPRTVRNSGRKGMLSFSPTSIIPVTVRIFWWMGTLLSALSMTFFRDWSFWWAWPCTISLLFVYLNLFFLRPPLSIIQWCFTFWIYLLLLFVLAPFGLLRFFRKVG